MGKNGTVGMSTTQGLHASRYFHLQKGNSRHALPRIPTSRESPNRVQTRIDNRLTGPVKNYMNTVGRRGTMVTTPSDPPSNNNNTEIQTCDEQINAPNHGLGYHDIEVNSAYQGWSPVDKERPWLHNPVNHDIDSHLAEFDILSNRIDNFQGDIVEASDSTFLDIDSYYSPCLMMGQSTPLTPLKRNSDNEDLRRSLQINSSGSLKSKSESVSSGTTIKKKSAKSSRQRSAASNELTPLATTPLDAGNIRQKFVSKHTLKAPHNVPQWKLEAGTVAADSFISSPVAPKLTFVPRDPIKWCEGVKPIVSIAKSWNFAVLSNPNSIATDAEINMMEKHLSKNKSSNSFKSGRRINAAEAAGTATDILEERAGDDDSSVMLSELISTNTGTGQAKSRWRALKMLVRFTGIPLKSKIKKNDIRNKDHQLDRVNVLLKNLHSTNNGVRHTAAHALGQLRFRNHDVVAALRRVFSDSDEIVVYEAVKAMLLLGMWGERTVAKVIHFLDVANLHVKLDLVLILHSTLQAASVAKNADIYSLLCILYGFVFNPLSLSNDNESPDENMLDEIRFRTTLCLGHFWWHYDKEQMAAMQREKAPQSSVGNNPLARITSKEVLVDALLERLSDKKTANRYEAVSLLIKELNITNNTTILLVLLDQVMHSSQWRLRSEATHLIAALGEKFIAKAGPDVFNILVTLLWDDPDKNVRNDVVRTLSALGLGPLAFSEVFRQIEHKDQQRRARAVTCLCSMGVRSFRVLRRLLDLIEDDPSRDVVMQAIKALKILEMADPRAINILEERTRMGGDIGAEASKTLDYLYTLRDDSKNLAGRNNNTWALF